MKITPERKPNVVDAASLNKFLLGTLNGIKSKEVTVEEADAISKVADKIVKLNLTRIMYMKTRNQTTHIEFFEGDENKILIQKT